MTETSQFPQWFALLSIGVGMLWVPFWLIVSVAYRRMHGKPVLFFGVRDAVFQERAASGSSTWSWYTRLGGARNALVVAVTHDRLIVRPFFPFTLLFLPEIYKLECEVPLHEILCVKEQKTTFTRRVRVEFRDPDSGQTREFLLQLRDPAAFVAALKCRR